MMLSIRSISAGYGPARVLFDLNLELRAGEISVILGRNGAGKSTTLKTVMAMVPLSGGQIWFSGKRIDQRSTWEIARAGMGYVPEERRIFPDLSVLENLEAGRRLPHGRAPSWSVARIFKLLPALAPLGERRAGTLSGGEQQMLAVARTLMGNPSCLLLDEPSEGLAPAVVELLATLVRTLRGEGMAVLLAEQNVRFALAVSDTAHIIEKGDLRFSGTARQLQERADLRAEYLAL